MTGPEHFLEAQQAIEASTWQRQTWSDGETPQEEQEMLYRGYMWEMQRAQVHAILALTAAYAADAIYRRDDRTEWDAATGHATTEVTR